MENKNKIAFLVDSTMVSTVEDMKVANIHMISLYVMLDEKPYKDVTEITPAEFYTAKAKGAKGSTSQPNVGDFVAKYEELRDAGYETIIAFTLPAVLSGTYQSATIATEMVDGVDVRVIETKSLTAICVEIVKDIMQYAETATSVDEIESYARESFSRTAAYFYVGSLDSLREGGRLSATQATIGSLLKLKPILWLTDSGHVEIRDKVRTEGKALKRLLELAKERGELERVVLLGAANKELFENFVKIFEATFPEQDYKTGELTPVVGTHIGGDAAAMFFQYKK
jgi:EDD domain protein, DegV family